MGFSVIANNPVIERQIGSRVVDCYGRPFIPEEWDVEGAGNDGESRLGPEFAGFSASISDFVEFAFKIMDKGKNRVVPFDLGVDRRYLRPIYDSTAKRILLKFGRQCEKSTMLANSLISYCCLVNGIRCLYVSPTNTQTKDFSRNRLDDPFTLSDHLMNWTTPVLLDNTFRKRFLNLSEILLRYAFLSADRVRGTSADLIVVDELQDILTDSLPVIEECMSHSPMKLLRYAGTPKSKDNTIEEYWNKQSTQNEWAIPCSRHTSVSKNGVVRVHWNIPSEDNLGKHSLICDKCKMPISARDPKAQWVSMNAQLLKSAPDPDAVFEGYRIPQIVVPWVSHAEILQKQHDYPRAQFKNEVLAEPSDEGTKPLTEDELRNCCNPNMIMTREYEEKLFQRVSGNFPVYAGIDWRGGSKANSYTVMTLGSYFDKDTFTYFYFRRFEGAEADLQVEIQEIMKVIDRYKVNRVGVDFGGGLWPNDALTRKYGLQKILQFQYSNPSKKIIWDERLGRFLVHRTLVMADVFSAIKRGRILEYPAFEWFKNPYGADFLSIFSEYNERTRMDEYHKTPGRTDDTFHSSLLCLLASMVDKPRPDILLPIDKK